MKKHRKPTVHEDPVEVPHADDMNDETFLKHIEARHSKECKVEGFLHRHNVPAWIGAYRAFHKRCHDLAVFGQYDHEHDDKEEE